MVGNNLVDRILESPRQAILVAVVILTAAVSWTGAIDRPAETYLESAL